jgi:hypothetical protein
MAPVGRLKFLSRSNSSPHVANFSRTSPSVGLCDTRICHSIRPDGGATGTSVFDNPPSRPLFSRVPRPTTPFPRTAIRRGRDRRMGGFRPRRGIYPLLLAGRQSRRYHCPRVELHFLYVVRTMDPVRPNYRALQRTRKSTPNTRTKRGAPHRSERDQHGVPGITPPARNAVRRGRAPSPDSDRGTLPLRIGSKSRSAHARRGRFL